MRYAVGLVDAIFLVGLVLGALTGRVRLRSCAAPSRIVPDDADVERAGRSGPDGGGADAAGGRED